VVKVNWSDNPWFPNVLVEEKDELKQKDYDEYLHIWDGQCKQMLEGAVYGRELRAAAEEGRIMRVPYDETVPVHTFWDLGWNDTTAIWFAQAVGFEYRIIDYYEERKRTVGNILSDLQEKKYVYGTDYLPHDAKASSLSAGGRTVEKLMKAAGRKTKVLKRTSEAMGINAARTIFSKCYFDEARCSDGLQALRHYRYDIDEETGQYSKKPIHDQYSHGADAFRYLAMSLTEENKNEHEPDDYQPNEYEDGDSGNYGWMSS